MGEFTKELLIGGVVIGAFILVFWRRERLRRRQRELGDDDHGGCCN